MKVIDLLNKIAKGEKNITFIFKNETYKVEKIIGELLIRRKDYGNSYIQLEDDFNIYDILNDEVEIIEEDKKIEKIILNDKLLEFPDGKWTSRNMDKSFAIKINELIDEVNKLKEEK